MARQFEQERWEDGVWAATAVMDKAVECLRHRDLVDPTGAELALQYRGDDGSEKAIFEAEVAAHLVRSKNPYSRQLRRPSHPSRSAPKEPVVDRQYMDEGYIAISYLTYKKVGNLLIADSLLVFDDQRNPHTETLRIMRSRYTSSNLVEFGSRTNDPRLMRNIHARLQDTITARERATVGLQARRLQGQRQTIRPTTTGTILGSIPSVRGGQGR